jgi:hypothetical protein
MKNNLKLIFAAAIVFYLGFSYTLYAQPVYKICDSKDIDMKLSGTFTFHKWEMNARTFSGEAQFGFMPGNDNHLTILKSLTFSLAVLNLKSDEMGLEGYAYKALKTDRYKNISYKLISAKVLPETENKYMVRTCGNLTIAGVTNEVIMDIYCLVNKDATITCIGSDKLKMTDYHVKPPSFALGAVKAGDAITLDFTLVYKK